MVVGCNTRNVLAKHIADVVVLFISLAILRIGLLSAFLIGSAVDVFAAPLTFHRAAPAEGLQTDRRSAVTNVTLYS